MPTVREVMDYIIKSAQSRGIDPNIALRVFNQESGFNPAATNITPREKSYGVTQLNTQGGLGVEAQKRGIDPTDPSQWMKHVDFSLDTVLRDGWRQWMGAKDTGVGRWQGVNAMANPPRPPGNIPVASGGNRTALIIHHSGGRGDHHGVINTLNQRGLGAQYIIDRNGNIHETGLPSRHMRPGQGVGKGLDNSNTYGVEIIGKDDNDILPIQIEAAKKLREQLGIDPKRVFGHGEVNTHKQATEGQQVVRAIRGMSGETNVAQPKAGTIDIGDKPQLAQLQPKSPFDNKVKATNWTLGQTAPTEQANTMARHPGFEENIKRAMAERGVQVAGFVPPGLTRGSAETRAAANKNVPTKGAPKSTVPDAETQIGRKDAPVTADEQAAISAWNKAHEDWLNGDGPNPGPPPTGRPEPRTGSATNPARATDPQTGTAVVPYDPPAVQNDPARQALIAAKIRGTARPANAPPPQLPPPPGGKQGDLAGPTAAAGAGAVVAGTMAGTQRPEAEKKNTGIPPSLEYLLVSGIPTVKEAMKDPETAGATKKVIQKVISTKARQDAAKADMANDPTFYQRQASKMTNQGGMGDPGSPQYDRMMQDAVARDNAGVMARRGQQPRPQQDPALQAVQQRIQQGPPPEEQPRSRGTISIRPTPDAIRNAPNTPVYPQPGPGQEKGGGPPPEPYPTAPTAGPSPHRFQQYGDAPPSQALPTGYQAPAESVVNHGYNGVPPQMNAQMMDPTMMQLMQFFTQGGGGGGFEGP